MKKLLIIMAVITMVFVASSAFAQLRESTDRLTADAAILTVKSGQSVGICGVYAEADGTNPATCAVYDNTTNSGKMFPKVIVAAGEYYGGWQKSTCVRVRTGLYLDITGTNAACWIEYTK